MEQQTRRFDLAVIGSGPGGEGAAIQAAKQGMRVVLIDRLPLVGGNCTHLGTIPSKALRHTAGLLTTVRNHPLFSPKIDQEFTFADLCKQAQEVIHKQVLLRASHYSRNDIEVLHGFAKLVGPNSIEVEKDSGVLEELEASYIVLATGSRPWHPEGIDFNHPRIFDSDTILNLRLDPRIISVYGAGVIGCEYTSIFRSLGKKVNLINTRDRLLSFLDNEIVDALAYHLRDQGVQVKHSEEYENVEAKDQEVIIHCKSGKKIRSDIVLFAVGRAGNVQGLGLEELGIEYNSRGQVVVNEHFQTKVQHIYAVGDLAGFPSLASSAYDQGRYASRHILNPATDTRLVKDIPIGIYTMPEISCIGQTEEELTKASVPYEVGHSSFKHLARAQITGKTVGMLKVLFHARTLQILGIHCFGQNAAEIIHIGQAIMSQPGENNSIRYFVDTTFNYPTMAEAYRVAALNGINRLCGS